LGKPLSTRLRNGRSVGNAFSARHHIAAVFDGRNKRLYMDGQLDAVATNIFDLFATNTYPVWIGALRI
jgi:hypothetical protein